MISHVLKNQEAIKAALSRQKHKLTMLTTSEWEKIRGWKPSLNHAGKSLHTHFLLLLLLWRNVLYFLNCWNRIGYYYDTDIINVLCASLIIHCRYVTELRGGETYVSCSVVLPALCHLYHTMGVTEEDPAYIGRFKTAFKKDLSERHANLNNGWLNIASALDPRFKDLKFRQRGDREEVWTSLEVLLQNKPSTATPEPAEKPPKKRTLLLFSSDTDSDDDGTVETCRALNRYKAEPSISMEECPLQWWTTHSGDHQQPSVLARKYLAAPASSVPCERLFSFIDCVP